MRRVLILGLIATAMAGCGRPAQIGVDPSAFKAVDALYTAVSLRDPKLVDQTGAILAELRAAGKLPDAAGEALNGIIAEAKSGGWEPAQIRLGDFMKGQRR